MIISHIGVKTLYYGNHGLFSRTKSLIYYKNKREQVKLIIFYKSAIDSNTKLFDPTVPKIRLSQVVQARVVSTYVQVVAL